MTEPKKTGWTMIRQSKDTTYIYFNGSWVATVRSDKAEELLELLKKTD